ncbi:hypothetical protein [Nocardiopsis sp. RV163]|uniref:hypothetical protein n=1 Tax=Nocardiopsis sp. RV163 TaxID=1661388 RepID=UPI00064BA49D|nr:hypothetical protein [Nocardiopsis sp. RV163]
MSSEAISRVLSVALLAALLAQSAGCSSQGGQGPSSITSEVQESNPPSAEFIRRKVSIETLGRMLGEGDSEQIIESAGQDFKESLVGSGAVFVSDGSYVAETSISEWETSEQPAEGTHMNAVDAGLSEVLQANDVTWCSSPSLSGGDFVQQYIDLYADSYRSPAEYSESISDYVDCGSGEL